MLSAYYAYLGVSISSKGLGLHIREQSQILTTYTRKPHPPHTIGGARKIPAQSHTKPPLVPHGARLMAILSLDQKVDSPESVVVAARIQVPFPAARLLGRPARRLHACDLVDRAPS